MSVKQQVSLSMVSHKTYAISTRNIKSELYNLLIYLFKKFGGKWNVAINQYEIPMQFASALLKEIQRNYKNILVKDVPLTQLRGVLSQGIEGQSQSKTVYIPPKHKWKRVLALDPLIISRYMFSVKFIRGYCPKGIIPKQTYKRVLFFCWQHLRSYWVQNVFKKEKFNVKDVDYQSLQPDSSYRIRPETLKDHQIEIITYQRLYEVSSSLSKSVLEKYTTIICDDSEVWVDSINSNYKYNDIACQMKEIISQKYGEDKELLMFMASLPMDNPQLLLTIANIMRPIQFGIDLLKSSKGEINDATWLKRRYINDNGYTRELYYILTSSFLINLLTATDNDEANRIVSNSKGSKIVSHEDRFVVTFPKQSLDKFKQIQRKYNKINRTEVITNLQSERSIKSYLYGEGCELEQAKYLKETRELMLQEKLPFILKYICHLTKQIWQRAVVIVQNQWGLQRVTKYFDEKKIDYLIYKITLEDLHRKGNKQHDFNLNHSKRVCILVRNKLLKEYRQVERQREKEIEQSYQIEMEQQLGLQKGGLCEIAQHKFRVSDPLFYRNHQLNLKKICTARHIFDIDSFWYDFSSEREDIINNIFDITLPMVNEDEANQCGRLGQNGMVQNWQKYFVNKKMDMVMHYFIANGSHEKSILERYNFNQSTHNGISEQIEDSNSISVAQFSKSMIDQWNNYFANKKNAFVYEGVYDCDEEFDKLQYEAMKERERIKNNLIQEEKPTYNTYIEGLIPQTPLLMDKKFQDIQQENEQIKIFVQRDTAKIDQIPQLQSSDSEDQDVLTKGQIYSNCNEINLQKYIAQPHESLPYQIQKKIPIAEDRKDTIVEGRNVKCEDEDSLIDDSVSNIKPIVSKQIEREQKQLVAKRKTKSYKLEIDDDYIQRFGKENERKKVIVPVKIPKTLNRPAVIDVQQFEAHKKRNNHRKRSTSFGLWGPRQDQPKVIARKYPTLRVKLIPGISSMKSMNK